MQRSDDLCEWEKLLLKIENGEILTLHFLTK